ncbi:hypothetical protein C7402_101407 [Paraburkholderia unamae]|uniref:PcfJ-like protein n=2 Tax=Paraburkholderia unamae TaxID=219649 RepID=A0ABX5KZ13_9BURK|nr:hypothetical protein C7402_101407 [Paraburkholderia unamae]
MFAACRRVVEAGIWLIRHGYGRMGLLPYSGAVGCWRCEFHLPQRPDKEFFRYSASQVWRYLENHAGGTLRKDVSPEKLAQAIMMSVPDKIKAACSGPCSSETERWLGMLEGAIAGRYLPEAFHEYTSDHSRWRLLRIDSGQESHIPPQPGYVRPGEARSAIDESDWANWERYWDSLARSRLISISTALLQDTEFAFDFASRLTDALEDVSSFDRMRVLRAAIASVQARSHDGGPVGWRATVSTSSSSDPVVRRATRLLSMVHELHKVGYQRLRICAGRSVTGGEWRLHIVPAGETTADGWTPKDTERWPSYTSDDGKKFFGWTDTDVDDARCLANKFVARFPEVAVAGLGQDWMYAGWFTEVLGRAEHDRLPAFYGGLDFFPADDESLPPLASGFSIPSPGNELIVDQALKIEMLPPPGASYELLEPFCLTYDGYRGGLRTIEDCFAVAKMVESQGVTASSIENLRTVAFIYQRKIKHNSELMAADVRDVRVIREVVEELRRRLTAR